MIKKNLFKTTLVLASLMAALLVGGCGNDKKTANTENNTNTTVSTVEIAKNDNTTTSEVKESVNSNTEASTENKTEEASVEENKENTDENNNEVNNESNDTENYVENNDSNDETYEENNDSWTDDGNNDEYTSEDNNTDVGNDTSNNDSSSSKPELSEEEKKKIENSNYDWDSNESVPNPYPLNVFTTRAYYEDTIEQPQKYMGEFTVIYTLNETRDWDGFEKACDVAYQITKTQRPDLVSKVFGSECIGKYKEGNIIASFFKN